MGTVTEIYDYFRLLYARIGIPHCPKCGREISKQSVDQMVDQIMSLPGTDEGSASCSCSAGAERAPRSLLEQARKSGYVRVMIDGSLYELSEEIQLDKNIKHNIEIVVDRLVIKRAGFRSGLPILGECAEPVGGAVDCRYDGRGNADFQSEFFLSGLRDQH